MKNSIKTKTVLLFFIILTSFFSLKSFGQCLTISVITTSATCSTCCDATGTISVSGGCPAYSYTITPNISGFPNLNGVCPGNYTIGVTDAGLCCPVTYYPFQMRYAGQTATSLVETKVETIDLVIQNPIQENINIYFHQADAQETYEVKVVDLQSRIVYTNSFTISNPTYSFKHNLTSGVYFIEVKEQTTKKIFKKKIVVNN